MSKNKKSTTNIALSSDDSENDETITKTNNKNKKDTVIKNDSLSKASERLQITKSLNNLTSISNSFIKAIDEWKEITSEKINEYLLMIDTKSTEYNELIIKLNKDYENKTNELEHQFTKKQTDLIQKFENKTNEIEQQFLKKQMETSLKIKEYEISACEDICKANNYKVIKINDYEKTQAELQNLREEVIELKEKIDDKVKEKFDSEKNILCDKHKNELSTAEFKFKVESADMIAQIRQQQKEIEYLNKTIDTLHNEVAEQRNLTKEIAKASSKSQITQNISKE